MKDLTKPELEAVKKSMESGIGIPKHLKNNSVDFKREDIQGVVSQMKDNFGEEEFTKMRGKVQEANKKNRKDKQKDKIPQDHKEVAKRLHRNYSNTVGRIDSIELVDSCISDLQELLVLCEVKKSELGSKG